MDDDLYNAINDDGDLIPQGSSLRYDYEDNELRVLNEINRAHRPPKRYKDIERYEPLDWHMRVPCTLEEIEKKRQKKDHEELILNQLTQRILQARKKRMSNQMMSDESAKRVRTSKNENQFALNLPPIDGTPWITMNSPDCSRRFYIRLKKPFTVENIFDKRKPHALGTSSTVIWKARESLGNEPTMTMHLADTVPLNNFGERLWVDKYAPCNFAELTSDDRINRLLLNWIKLWDECVFRKPLSDMCGTSEEMLLLEEGNPKRPKYKIALITGPPGIGKTTLATIVARHAGYAVVEINASDDRNVADFEKCINNAVETINTLDTEKKPICLLLDEIDGAPAESIGLLCKIATRTGKKSTRRPIISICNNLYCPSLRELRSVALVLQMPYTDNDRLVRRLHKISMMEELRIDNAALSALVIACGSDLRSCINSLQYLSMHFSKTVIDSDMVTKHVSTNQHFTSRTLFGAWSYVLEQKNHIDHKGRMQSATERTQSIFSVAESITADSHRFFVGLFANYLNPSLKLAGVLTLKSAADQFCDYDILSSFINHSSNYSFIKYTFIIIAAIHFLVSSPNRVQLVFPTAEQSFTQCRKQACDILHCLKTQKTFASASNKMLALDILPSFTVIVQPPIKQTNIQLLNDRDKELFQNVVCTMCFYSITFKPQLKNGVTSFSFFPPIDQIALFPLDDADEIYNRMTQLPKTTRQAIAHQIELSSLGSQTFMDIPKQEAQPLKTDLSAVVVGASIEVNKRQLCFHYNKGFSNAIRRNIRMRNLIFDN